MKDKIARYLARFDTNPFLFIGSGLSRRYLELDDWRGLLRHFANLVKDNEFALEIYEQQAQIQKYNQGINQKVAELIEHDFNQLWYSDSKFGDERTLYKKEVIEDKISPFKLAIANYINQKKTVVSAYEKEVNLDREEHTSELQSPDCISYAVFCL